MPFPILHPKADVAGPAYVWLSDFRNPSLAGDVLLDSGALAAGDYEAIVTFASGATNVQEGEVQRRNAANLATLAFMPIFKYAETDQAFLGRITLAANERIRVQTTLGFAGITRSSMQYRRVG